MPTTVVNIKTDDFDVCIDRSTKWGNPFSHLDYLFPNHQLIWVPTRREAVERHKLWLPEQSDLMEALWELKDKVLGCHCKPRLCHGDNLAYFADLL